MKFNQNVFPFFLAIILAFSMTLVSCDNEESDFLELEELNDDQADLRGGDDLDGERHDKKHNILRLLKGDCIALTYPVTVNFPDGTSVTAIDVDELIAALRAYHTTADPSLGRPNFVYPLTIIVGDTTFDVNSAQELHRAAKLCRDDRPDRKRPCFKIVYPLTIEFPGGRTTQVASQKEFNKAVRRWKAANPTSDERPVIVYPIEIEFRDGTTRTINSKEELKAAKAACD